MATTVPERSSRFALDATRRPAAPSRNVRPGPVMPATLAVEDASGSAAESPPRHRARRSGLAGARGR